MADKILDVIEKQVIAGVMRATKGNKKKCAEALGIYRPQLYTKLKKHGLSESKSKACYIRKSREQAGKS